MLRGEDVYYMMLCLTL